MIFPLIFSRRLYGLVESGSGNQRLDDLTSFYIKPTDGEFSSKEKISRAEKRRKELLEFRESAIFQDPYPWVVVAKMLILSQEGIDIHRMRKAEERDG